MNKLFLTRIALGLGVLMMAGQASAQVAVKYQGNSAAEQVGARFIVNTPSSVAGVKTYTIANDSTGTDDWGAAITNPFINIQLAKAYDTLGANPLLNGVVYPSLAGKFALIFRGGGITFTQKAKYCQDKGALACIIVNNIPGGPVGMAYTAPDSIGIPVIMVSKEDGEAMNAQLKLGANVTISLTKWGYNLPHDLGFLSHASVLPHAFAIPLSQVGNDNGNPTAYKNQSGAYIGNFGTTNETNVKISSNVSFTPTGGSSSVVYRDSIAVGSFARIDSILIPRNANSYDLHATSTGRFDFQHTLTADSTDQANGDNAMTESMYVTDSVFSKSRYNFSGGIPFASTYYRFNSADNYVAGPLYYISKAGYQIKRVQMSLSAGTGFTPESLGSVEVNIFKWVDANGDSVMTTLELTKVGGGAYSFAPGDSNQQFFNVDITGNDGTSLLKVQDAGWYWASVAMQGSAFLGCDGILNYMPRTYIRSRANSTNRAIEFATPVFQGEVSTLFNGDQLVTQVPLQPEVVGSGTYPDSAALSVQKIGLVPSVAMIMSTTTVSINRVNPSIGNVSVYPNPAVGYIDANIALSKPTSKLYARITDGFGKIVRTISFDNVQKQIVRFNTIDLASGQYYMVVVSDQGYMSKPFTVVAK